MSSKQNWAYAIGSFFVFDAVFSMNGDLLQTQNNEVIFFALSKRRDEETEYF